MQGYVLTRLALQRVVLLPTVSRFTLRRHFIATRTRVSNLGNQQNADVCCDVDGLCCRRSGSHTRCQRGTYKQVLCCFKSLLGLRECRSPSLSLITRFLMLNFSQQKLPEAELVCPRDFLCTVHPIRFSKSCLYRTARLDADAARRVTGTGRRGAAHGW